jgi:hypothetical protein
MARFSVMPPNLIETLPERLEAALSQLLHPNETVEVKLKGAFKEGLICTNRRVIILKGGFMTGQTMGNNTFQLTYANVSGVQVQFHRLSGFLEVNAGGMQNSPKSYWSSDKSHDPSKAPNCVSLNRKDQKPRFDAACTFILHKIDEVHMGSAAAAAPVSFQPQPLAAPAPSRLEQLKTLGELRDSGVLTPEEFEAEKALILGKTAMPNTELRDDPEGAAVGDLDAKSSGFEARSEDFKEVATTRPEEVDSTPSIADGSEASVSQSVQQEQAEIPTQPSVVGLPAPQEPNNPIGFTVNNVEGAKVELSNAKRDLANLKAGCVDGKWLNKRELKAMRSDPTQGAMYERQLEQAVQRVETAQAELQQFGISRSSGRRS